MPPTGGGQQEILGPTHEGSAQPFAQALCSALHVKKGARMGVATRIAVGHRYPVAGCYIQKRLLPWCVPV